MAKQVNRVGDLEATVVVAVGGILAGRTRTAQVEKGQQEDGVGQVDPFVVVRTAADEGLRLRIGGEGREAEDPGDEWSEFTRERYHSSGVGLSGQEIRSADTGSWADVPAAVCEVDPNQTCEVRVTLERETPGKLGGLPVYRLRYDVEVR